MVTFKQYLKKDIQPGSKMDDIEELDLARFSNTLYSIYIEKMPKLKRIFVSGPINTKQLIINDCPLLEIIELSHLEEPLGYVSLHQTGIKSIPEKFLAYKIEVSTAEPIFSIPNIPWIHTARVEFTGKEHVLHIAKEMKFNLNLSSFGFTSTEEAAKITLRSGPELQSLNCYAHKFTQFFLLDLFTLTHDQLEISGKVDFVVVGGKAYDQAVEQNPQKNILNSVTYFAKRKRQEDPDSLPW